MFFFILVLHMSVILFLLGLFSLFAFLMTDISQKSYFTCVCVWVVCMCVCVGCVAHHDHVWVCIHACICLCVHVKARDQHWVSVFIASVSVWDRSLKDLPVSASALSPAQGLYMHTLMPGFLSGFWGSEQSSSCSCSRHFTHWVGLWT